MPLPVLVIPLAQTGISTMTKLFQFNSTNNALKVEDTARVEALNDILFPLHSQLRHTLTGEEITQKPQFPKSGAASLAELNLIITPEIARKLKPAVIESNRLTLAAYKRADSASNFTHVTLVPAILDMLDQVIARGAQDPSGSKLSTPVSDFLGATPTTLGGMAVEASGEGQKLNLASAAFPGITTGPALLILGAGVVIFILFLVASKTGRSQ